MPTIIERLDSIEESINQTKYRSGVKRQRPYHKYGESFDAIAMYALPPGRPVDRSDVFITFSKDIINILQTQVRQCLENRESANSPQLIRTIRRRLTTTLK